MIYRSVDQVVNVTTCVCMIREWLHDIGTSEWECRINQETIIAQSFPAVRIH
jgi:hypothetical protein